MFDTNDADPRGRFRFAHWPGAAARRVVGAYWADPRKPPGTAVVSPDTPAVDRRLDERRIPGARGHLEHANVPARSGRGTERKATSKRACCELAITRAS
jgi:hypothetical protein